MPENTPSVAVVVRHLNQPLMQRFRSLDRDKAFEAVRDNSGFCVDKHFGNVHRFLVSALMYVCEIFVSTTNARCTSEARCMSTSRSADAMQQSLLQTAGYAGSQEIRRRIRL